MFSHSVGQAAMAWIVFYYIVLKPLNLMPSDEKINEKYDDADLHPRFSIFRVSPFCLYCHAIVRHCCVATPYTTSCINRLTNMVNMQNWREYEHAHTFFWCGKDLSWNLDLMPMWLIFFIPTLLIGFDFMWVTYKSKVSVCVRSVCLCFVYVWSAVILCKVPLCILY